MSDKGRPLGQDDDLIIMTLCDEHGVESVVKDAVVIATRDGAVFSFSKDPETGGLLVFVPDGTVAFRIVAGKDGTGVRQDTILLLNPGHEPAPLPPGTTVN